MAANNLCQYLEWDSQFFGRKIARVTLNQLQPEIAAQIQTWCSAEGIDCLYFLADAEDGQTIRLAEDNAFRFVDIRLTFERRLDSLSALAVPAHSGEIRLSRPEDVPALQAIAGVSHRDSRFYYDPNFLTAQSDALYETWIERSCQGYANAVLVVELDGQPVGYISCHLAGSGAGQIGLVGVNAAWQGRQLGQRLVNAALYWFAGQDVTQVTVVTQGRNCKAQRLYQRCGFMTQSVQLWYHRWFLSKESECRTP